MTLRRQVLIAVLLFTTALALTSCATLPVAGDADPRLVRALKELPRDGAWERMQCWSGVRLTVDEKVPVAAISVCTIHINPVVLTWEHEIIRAALAHEVGHMLNNDAGAFRRIGMSTLAKERQADARAVLILSRISLDACLALPRLLERLSSNAEAERTHPAPAIRAGETRAWCYAEVKR